MAKFHVTDLQNTERLQCILHGDRYYNILESVRVSGFNGQLQPSFVTWLANDFGTLQAVQSKLNMRYLVLILYALQLLFKVCNRSTVIGLEHKPRLDNYPIHQGTAQSSKNCSLLPAKCLWFK